jgi:hypothetical protein
MQRTVNCSSEEFEVGIGHSPTPTVNFQKRSMPTRKDQWTSICLIVQGLKLSSLTCC